MGQTKRFSGQVAVVTGAAGGIGGAIALRLASDGATVVACDRPSSPAQDVVERIVLSGGQASVLSFELTDAQECADAIAAVADRWGRIDVLVNNAGINRRGDLLTVSEADWRDTLDVNLNAVFHLTRAALPHLMKGGGGAIVNTASQWGIHPAPGHIAYNVSKAAVVAFTKSLARDNAPHGVRVNAVAPGEIHTPMLEAGLARQGRTVADLDVMVPYGRIGRPEEVAALVAFLASDEAQFICGSVVEITGAQAVS